jgi:hypothetical protein
MGRMCDGICKNCDCGNDDRQNQDRIERNALLNKPATNITNREVEDLKRAYRTLKNIAEGGGSNPRIYAQNTIDAIKVDY